MPKIALLGPIPPFRSGIADQTVRLARALGALGHEPVVVTFRRMYPPLLYPGAADRGAGAFPADLGDVRPLLDGWNPLSFRAAAHVLAREDVDLAILPWWTAFFAPHALTFLSSLTAQRPAAVKLLLCHNLFDHEGSAAKNALARAVFRRADRFAVQNRASADALRAAFPGKPVAFVPHPFEPRPAAPSRGEARRSLGLPPDAPVFLFTGLLRPYKGWDVALAAFPAVHAAFPEAILVLAGEPWGDARALSDREPPAGVRLHLGFLPEDERERWLAAADALVCPYRNATGSGIAADALAFAAPVIGTRVEGLVDVLDEGETALLVPPDDAPALSEAMRRFLRDGLAARMSERIRATRDRFLPAAHARAILAAGGIESVSGRNG